MNAKELIEAATRMKKRGVGGFTSLDDIDLATDHILATVHRDDDEPVTRERLEADGWVKSKYCQKWYIIPREHLSIEVEEDSGDWFFKLGVDDVCIAKMRDIRRLVAALGEK